MLDYDGIDVSENIDIDKNSNACECIICHYLYFLKTNFRFQSKVCDGCHNMMQKSIGYNDFTVVTAGRNDYRINFKFMHE